MTYFILEDYLAVVQQANLLPNDDRRRESDREQKNERCVKLALQTLFLLSSQNAAVSPTRLSEPPTHTHAPA